MSQKHGSCPYDSGMSVQENVLGMNAVLKTHSLCYLIHSKTGSEGKGHLGQNHLSTSSKTASVSL